MRKKIHYKQAEQPKKVRLHRLKNHPFLIPVTTFLVLFFVTIVAIIGMGGQTIGANDTRVVLLHIDGKEQVVPTRAKTVSDLLSRLNVKVGEHDIIEPALDTEIIDNNFTINLYTARTVSIEYEGKRTVLFTAQPSPERIAREIGIQVFPEDNVEKVAVVVEPLQALNEGIVADSFVIDRAVPVFLNLYGSPFAIRTQAETVGDLLKEKGVKTLEGDKVQPAPETPISDNLQVFVIREGKEISSREEVVDPPVERKEDPGLKAGTTIVLEAGAPGRRVVTYEIDLQNGQEVARREIQSVIIQPAVKRVIKVGTKRNTFSGSFEAALSALRGCESGGNYANKSNPNYRGAYQYGWTTWNNYAGYHDPADAPPFIQDQKAWETYQGRGWQPWPTCSQKLGLQDTYR